MKLKVTLKAPLKTTVLEISQTIDSEDANARYKPGAYVSHVLTTMFIRMFEQGCVPSFEWAVFAGDDSKPSISGPVTKPQLVSKILELCKV